jgi:hypothetical protein
MKHPAASCGCREFSKPLPSRPNLRQGFGGPPSFSEAARLRRVLHPPASYGVFGEGEYMIASADRPAKGGDRSGCPNGIVADG